MDTKVSTPELVRLSYVTLDQPRTAPGSTEPKYSISVIIPKSNKKTLKLIEKAIAAAVAQGKEKHGSKWVAKKLPLRDGDEEREDAAYADSFFLNASSKNKPGIVDRKVQPILDPKEIKSGDWGNVSINFYPFNVNGNAGIAVGLNHVQKVKDGEPLGNQTNAADEFDEVEFDDEEL